MRWLRWNRTSRSDSRWKTWVNFTIVLELILNTARAKNVCIHQKQYIIIMKLIEKYRLSKANLSKPADSNTNDDRWKEHQHSRQLCRSGSVSVHGWKFVVCSTRPDIAQAVGVIPKFNVHMHLTAVKQMLQYLKGTPDFSWKIGKRQ